MQKRSRIISLMLLALYLGYFAGASFFVHVHNSNGRIIVHSHPFTNSHHKHSSHCFQLIDLLQDRNSSGAEDFDLPACAQLQRYTIESVTPEQVLFFRPIHGAQLRAPPRG